MKWIELLKDWMGKKAGERLAVAEADAQPLVTAGIARWVEDDPLTPVIARGIESALAGFTRGLDGIINAALKQFAQAQRHSRKNAAPLLFGDGQEGDPKGKSFGDWLLAVARKDTAYLERHYGSSLVSWGQKAALGESSGAAGGYTVPPDFYENIATIAAEEAIFRKYGAWEQPMASATFNMPTLDITTAQAAGNSPFFGGVKATWTAEAQTRTETEPGFKMMELKAWELSGYSVSSNVLLQDSAVGLDKLLMMLFGKAVAWYEDYAFLQGNGVGKPTGILNASATLSVNRAAGGQVQFVDVAKMWGSLMPASWGRCVWTFTPTCVQQLLQLKDGANRAIFISVDQGIVKTPNWAILGRPAIPTEKMPALGTRGDLALFDPSLYVIGDRLGLEIAASEHVNFLANQMTWRFVKRLDGRPWLDNPITLQDGTTQVSPFVVLN
jgi:HK97 family phage major capsid protein